MSLDSRRVRPRALIGAIAACCGVGCAVLAVSDSDRALSYSLAAFQTVLVAWLLALAWSPTAGWARAGVVTAGAWILTFLVPSWIFAVDPSLLDVGSLNRALATVDESLVCFVVGYVWLDHRLAARRPGTDRPELRVQPVQVHQRTLAVWVVVGFLGLTTMWAVTGGPINFLEHNSHEGALSAGRTYFVAAALALVWAAQYVACARWASGRPLSRSLIAVVSASILLIATLAARELLAVPLVELALYFSLVRQRISLRRALPLVLAGTFVIVFALGMVKRYSNYVDSHPGTHVSRLDFLVTKGPGDFLRSYAVNTADGVRLIALGESIVPSHAPPEYGRELLRLLVHPIPSGIRPTVPTSPAIKAAIYPYPTAAYAQPLQLVAYLQLTYAGVILAFLAIGAASAAIDHALSSGRALRPSTILLLVAAATAVPMVLRGAAAASDASTLIEVLGLWIVARTAERVVPAPTAADTGPYAATAVA